MEEKIHGLQPIYDAFEDAAAPFKEEAACRKGCAFCCSDAGSIDITTLEGLVIRDRVNRLPRQRLVTLKKNLAADMKRWERGKPSSCPLLMKNRACMVYDVRPFACRRIYSLETCGPDRHPVLSRRAMVLGDQTIRTLQMLDDTGYSGHLSYILHMLETPAFLNVYLAGRFNPEAVMAFGRSHGIIINRIIVQQEGG
jgi:Fe-S-cluster containining protein